MGRVAQIDAAQEPSTVLEELAQGEGDAAERVFDRSFNLPQLGDDGRAALLALSLFVPSASRESLAAVAGYGEDEKRVNEAVKNLRALWLIKGIDENSRFTIEGLTRSLAGARLSKEAHADEVRQRFVALFLLYAETHAQPTREDYDALEAEKDNLLSAIDVAFDSEDWESVQRLAYILADSVDGMLSVRGYWDEALKRGEQAMGAARKDNNEQRVAVFAANTANIRVGRGEYGEAEQVYQETLAAFRKLGDDPSAATCLHHLGVLAQEQGKLKEARRLYTESLEIKKRFSDQSNIAITLYELGRLAQKQGEMEEARQLYNESLEIAERLGDQRGIATTLHELGRLAQNQGEVEEARRLYNESLEIAKRLGDQSGIATTLGQLGRLAAQEGKRTEAVQLFNEALRIFEKLKSPYAEMARQDLKGLEDESS
jgi:tetratricopeptide (TPR) repeat protein